MKASLGRHLVMLGALAAICAALAAGCTDEEKIFVERPFFTDPPQAARGFLGYDEPAETLTVCGNCHVGQQARWQTSAHSGAWQTLQASGAAQAFCEGCHSVNARGNEIDEPAGYSAVPDPRYHDVQCESCHGPGLTHVSNPDATQPLAFISVSFDTMTSVGTNCAECHQGNHHPFVEEWLKSKHAEVNTEVRDRASSNPASYGTCLACHSAQGVLSAWGVRADYRDKNAPVAEHSGITCAVCHDPHGSPFDAQLRFPINVPDVEQNLCMKCHHRRATPEIDAASLRGPHSPEGPLLLGEAGWWPPEFQPRVDQIVATHGTTGNPKLCAGCHVALFEVRDEETDAFVFNATGHLFEPIPCLDDRRVPMAGSECDVQERSFKSCAQAGCHGTETSARSAYLTAKQRIDELVAEVDRLIALTPPGAFDRNDGVFTVADGAWFNARLGELPGTSTHNPFLSEQLLRASIRALEQEYHIPASPHVSLDLMFK
jgi:predicted CXXCH cytochrome family protein